MNIIAILICLILCFINVFILLFVSVVPFEVESKYILKPSKCHICCFLYVTILFYVVLSKFGQKKHFNIMLPLNEISSFIIMNQICVTKLKCTCFIHYRPLGEKIKINDKRPLPEDPLEMTWKVDHIDGYRSTANKISFPDLVSVKPITCSDGSSEDDDKGRMLVYHFCILFEILNFF